MTLLGLLTDRLAPGVWRSDDEPDDVDGSARALGWDVRRVVLSDDKGRVITDLAEAAGAPGYVRANWDSLADGLKDIDAPDGHRLLLVIETAGSAHDSTVVDILNEASSFLARFGTRLQIVWIGPGDAPHVEAVHPIRSSRLGRTARTRRRPDQ